MTTTLIALAAIWPPVHPADAERIKAFAMLMRDGVAFPPVRAVEVEGMPGRYRLTDGAHWAAAARLAGITHFESACLVLTDRDARPRYRTVDIYV
jgi:hypothetical protein